MDHNIVRAKDTIEELLYKAARATYNRCEVYTVEITKSQSRIKMVNNRLCGEMTNATVSGDGYGKQIANIKKGKVTISVY